MILFNNISLQYRNKNRIKCFFHTQKSPLIPIEFTKYFVSVGLPWISEFSLPLNLQAIHKMVRQLVYQSHIRFFVLTCLLPLIIILPQYNGWNIKHNPCSVDGRNSANNRIKKAAPAEDNGSQSYRQKHGYFFHLFHLFSLLLYI